MREDERKICDSVREGDGGSPLPGWFKLALVSQLAVGALMVFVGIGSAPLWFDELASLAVAERSIGGILDLLATTDANMGFYYLLLHGWLWAGDGESWVRMLSALPALATVPLTAIIARRLFGDAVGVVAGFLMAGSMFAIANAQNARAYPLALLLVTIAALFFIEAVLTGRRACFAGCAVASALAVYASPLAALVLVGLIASLPFLPRPRNVVRPIAITFVSAALAVLPLALLIARAGGDQVDHLQRPGFGEALATLGEMLAMNYLPLAAALALLIGVALFVLWRDTPLVDRSQAGPWRWRRSLLVGWAFVPVVTLFGYSQIDPLFRARYLLTSAPAIAILIAVGLVAITRRSQRLGVAAVAALVCLTVLARADLQSYGEYLTPGWSEGDLAAARLISSRSRPGDGILYRSDWQRLSIAQNLEREAAPDSSLPDDFAVTAEPEEIGDLYAREAPPAVLKQRLRAHDRVWLLGWETTEVKPPPGIGLAVLRSGYEPVLRRDFGMLELELFRRSRRG